MKKGGRSKRLLQFLWDTVLDVVKPIDALPITPLIEPSLIALAEPIDWDEDVVVGPTETYDALVRSIGRTAGFGMFFVRCVEGDRDDLIARLRSDLPRLKLEQMVLDSELADGNLYRRVKEIVGRDPVNVLCISGLEKSFDPYVKSGYGGVGDYYHKDMVPRVLGHLNLQRERFRDDFPFCFIFFLSTFGIKFIARRSPDFFDWRSGIFEFVPDAEVTRKLTQEMYGDYQQYLTWTHVQRIDRIRDIQALIDEDQQTTAGKANLFGEKGNILAADNSQEEAIASYEKAIEFKPDNHEAWSNRGVSLNDLGRNEEAIASYEKAIEIKPDYHEAWYNRGISLSALGRNEEAIASYEKAIEIKPDKHEAWYNRGNSLSALGRNEEAIASYEKAIEFKPDKYEAWNARAILLRQSGQAEEALKSYDRAIEIKPDYYDAWDNRGYALFFLKRHQEAIESYDKAIEINPTFANAYYNRACAQAFQGDFDRAISDLSEAIRLEPEEYRKLASTDSDFELLREDSRFLRMLN
jgi:tetratricopeptide (TPR) repeat protein